MNKSVRRSSSPSAKSRLRACRANGVFLYARSFLLGFMLAAVLLSRSMSLGAEDPRVESLGHSRDGVRALTDLGLLRS